MDEVRAAGRFRAKPRLAAAKRRDFLDDEAGLPVGDTDIRASGARSKG